jgi:alpha-galactosidase
VDVAAASEPMVLSAGGSSLVVDLAGPAVPRVLHWGADVGPLGAAALAGIAVAADQGIARAGLDQGLTRTLLPTEADGWHGRPAASGHRDGRWSHPRWTLTAPATTEREDGGAATLRFQAGDADAGVTLDAELRMEAQGVLRVRYALTNAGTGTWTVDGLRCLLPLPDHAGELLDLTGRWCRERSPQRGPLRHGSHARESRRGRTGHDATGLLVAGTPGFGFRHGEVWGVHVGWSGNHLHLAERLPEGASLGGGELLGPGEVRLAPGERYQTPWVFFVHADRGLDGLSAKLHRWLRARPRHPRSPRPVVLNTWEAVYFDHRLDRLAALAERAATIGVERFVLDDGWFLGRRDDTAGLGDWLVDPDVWPDGLHPLVRRVRELGMQFGLWVEPEMVNPDSELARAHPDWLLAAPGRPPPPWRHQQVLDLARPEAFDHLLGRLDALVAEYQIDYLKWDCNRDLHEAVHDGSSAVHRQTLAVYRLLDELRRRHPALEVESCASGGARIDLGILERTDRVWASDSNDPLERQPIQRWTGLLLPPELVGSHVGPERAHTTGRRTDLGFRCATALFGHAGLEWDLLACTPAEVEELAAWIRLYRRLRPLLHGGEVVRADHPDPSAWLHGVVAADGRHAVFAVVQLATSAEPYPARLRLPGLDPATSYLVRPCAELPPPTGGATAQPSWTDGDGVALPGRVLATVGLPAPMLQPAQAAVFEANAAPSA